MSELYSYVIKRCYTAISHFKALLYEHNVVYLSMITVIHNSLLRSKCTKMETDIDGKNLFQDLFLTSKNTCVVQHK